jgi:hypothetical protein
VVEKLAALGVRLIAMRCAGFDRVDLEACAKHDITVVRVPTYSPESVAEHAVALMFALSRCGCKGVGWGGGLMFARGLRGRVQGGGLTLIKA